MYAAPVSELLQLTCAALASSDVGMNGSDQQILEPGMSITHVGAAVGVLRVRALNKIISSSSLFGFLSLLISINAAMHDVEELVSPDH